MSQYVIDQKDLSAVNYVIENALYTDKLLKDDLTIDDTTKTISFKLANVPSITFTIPHTLVPNAEKYNLGTPKYTATASERSAWVADAPSLSVRLMCRYIYLDDFERRQFAVNTHEYIVTEYQHHQHFVTAGSDQVSIDLKFNHPTKELIFFYRADEWWGDDSSAKTHYDGYWSFANPESTFGDNHLFSTANLKIKTFTRTKAFEDLLDAMKIHLGMDKLMERVQGGTPSMQGTWMHTSLIWHVAAWISPVFAVAAMDWADIFYNTPACPKGCMKTLATRMFQDAGRQSAQRSEVDVRDNVALRVGGQVEVKVGDTSMRADIVSYKCKMLLEVKEFTRWTDAVGQLLVYGHHFPGLTKVIVVFDRDGKDIAEEQLDLIEFHVQGLDMMVCTEQYFEKYTV
eukprot:jgi/Mesvir1/9137/Mv14387-RA.1